MLAYRTAVWYNARQFLPGVVCLCPAAADGRMDLSERCVAHGRAVGRKSGRANA